MSSYYKIDSRWLIKVPYESKRLGIPGTNISNKGWKVVYE